MDTIPEGSTVLLVSSAEDVAAAEMQLQEQGFVVGKRVSAKVVAAVCVPCESALTGKEAKQVQSYRARSIRIVDFDDQTSASGSASASSCLQIPSPRRRKRVSASASLQRSLSSPSKFNATDISAPEKRLAPWRGTCSGATMDRIERAREQRMYLVEQKELTDPRGTGPAREYAVLGSTGNVYKVQIAGLVSCNCPDAAKGNVCKHQLFVFLRVLRTPSSSQLIYQRGLLSNEREQLFAAARRPRRNAVASACVREAYAEAVGSAPSKKARKLESAESCAFAHRGDEDDECTICFEILGKEKLKVCTSCRNAVHEACFLQWAQAKGNKTTCPTCREPWSAPVKKSRATGITAGFEGYLNLAAEAGLPSQRDESSYRYFSSLLD